MGRTYHRLLKYAISMGLALSLCACGNNPEDDYQPTLAEPAVRTGSVEYIVGIHPLHNPRRLMQTYGPIIEYVNLKMPGVRIKLETSRNYEEYDKKLYSGHFDFAMPNPYETILALKHGYHVFGKMANDEQFRGIILVRKDSGIKQVTDLKGRAVSYPAPSALAGTMMPQLYLQTHGVDVMHDLDNRYVGSQESSIMNVYRGRVAAGSTWPVPWQAFQAENPQMADELEVKWQTAALPSVSWMAHERVPAAVSKQFAEQILALHENNEGRMMLGRIPLSRFEPATDASFEPIKEFLAIFSKLVRPVEQ